MVRDSNPCQKIERRLGYHFINEACQIVHQENGNCRNKNSPVWNSDKETLLTLNLLHPTGIERMSIACKFTPLPLHQKCWSFKTRTVEEIMDLNPSEAMFPWKFPIRLRLLPLVWIKLMSVAWRSAMLRLHQRCSAIPTWKRENIKVVYSFVTKVTADFLSMLKHLHRTGIEPMSIAWKATMLPLHQRWLSTQF